MRIRPIGIGRPSSAMRTITAVLVALVALMGLADAAVAKPPAQLQISTDPSQFPSFDQSVSDYVVRCQPSNEVHVSVAGPSQTKVSVDGGRGRGGSFTETVSLSEGEGFDIVATAPKQTKKTFFIRCLPSDFPTFTATRTGPTQAEWYAVAPSTSGTAPSGVSQHYLALFDNNGVPVWWMRSASIPRDAKLLPNGNVAYTRLSGGAEEHRLNGSLVRTLDTVPAGSDFHDIQLPNGNYLIGRTFTRSGVNMSSCGGPTSGNLRDFELQELSPTGALVWSWRASDHIPLSEVTVRWQGQCSATGGDIYHWNSVESDGDGYVLSFRHLDSVYRIDAGTGAIDWKLGGETRPESLTVVGDPLSAVSTFCGQHDPRVLADGSLTVHDNGTGCNRPPRAVRFAIDDTAHTATLIEDLRDTDAPSSACCGSTRRLPGGNWVSQWGANPYVTEQTGTGVRVFKLSFPPGAWSYRANPVLPGVVSPAALRAGMDAQYPRP
jgi:hypothetical protein